MDKIQDIAAILSPMEKYPDDALVQTTKHAKGLHSDIYTIGENDKRDRCDNAEEIQD